MPDLHLEILKIHSKATGFILLLPDLATVAPELGPSRHATGWVEWCG